MGTTTVIVSFIVCFIFNIFLNSFDVYSDTALAYNALTFNLGSSILLSGCRVCHGKEYKDVFKYKNNSCQQCLTKNGGFECGRSFEMLNKLNELQNKDSCENQHFAFNYNSSSKSYDFRNGVCDKTSDYCCVENTDKPNISSPLEYLDKRIIAIHTKEFGYDRNKLKYDTYVLSGKLSLFYCFRFLSNYFNWDPTVFYDFINKNITNLNTQNKSNVMFKFVKSKNNTFNLESGFSYKDDCGLLVTNKLDIYFQNNAENTCESDSCLVHIQYLKKFLNISDLDDWKQNTFYDAGRKFGGQVCDLVWKFGLTSIVPITVNMIFNLLVFLDDLNGGYAFKAEILFVLVSFYPQWRTLRFLGEYLYNRNEDQLNRAKEKYDVQVSSLEPFLEAAFQVRKCYPSTDYETINF